MQKKPEHSRLVYQGEVFRIEFYVAAGGVAPAEVWLNGLEERYQAEMVAALMGLSENRPKHQGKKLEREQNSTSMITKVQDQMLLNGKVR